MTLFNNYIQAGRLAICRFGELVDKPCIIVDIVTLTRVLVFVPGHGRVMVPLRRLVVTEHRLDIARACSDAEVEEALKANDVVAQWRESKWGKNVKMHQRKRELNDFERFRVQRALRYVKQQL